MTSFIRFCPPITTGLLIISLSARYGYAQEGDTTDERQPDIVVLVEGMVCDNCAYQVEKRLGNLDSVRSVEVRLDDQQVFVTLNEGATVEEEVLRKAILDAGFKPVDVRYGTDDAHAVPNEPDKEES